MAAYRIAPVSGGPEILAPDYPAALRAVREMSGNAGVVIDATYAHDGTRVVARVFDTAWWQSHNPCACSACAWHRK